ETVRVRQPKVVGNPLSEELKKLATYLTQIGRNLKSDEESIEFTSAANRCQGLSQALDQWLTQGLDGQVYWVEVTGERKRITIACAPIEVGPALQEMLYSDVPTVILTSATLSAGSMTLAPVRELRSEERRVG